MTQTFDEDGVLDVYIYIYFPIVHVAETVGHAKSSLLSCPWGAHLLESPCLAVIAGTYEGT